MGSTVYVPEKALPDGVRQRLGAFKSLNGAKKKIDDNARIYMSDRFRTHHFHRYFVTRYTIGNSGKGVKVEEKILDYERTSWKAEATLVEGEWRYCV